tara:strand:+ start:68 stop:343 length:276 start_codon:yes stop_codon:yes gene_type:complete
MILSEHYQNYRGPSLIKAILDDTEITNQIQEKYGPNKNWQGYLWTYKELFGSDSYGKNFRCDFISEDGRKYWFYGFINDTNQYFNPPLHIK